MELNELKAKAYDLIAAIEAHKFAAAQIQKELAEVNAKISDEMKKAQE